MLCQDEFKSGRKKKSILKIPSISTDWTMYSLTFFFRVYMHRMLQTDDPKVTDKYSNWIRFVKAGTEVIASHTEPINEPFTHVNTQHYGQTSTHKHAYTLHTYLRVRLYIFPLRRNFSLDCITNSLQHWFAHLSLLIIPMPQSVSSTANIK